MTIYLITVGGRVEKGQQMYIMNHSNRRIRIVQITKTTGYFYMAVPVLDSNNEMIEYFMHTTPLWQRYA